jgi:hypothetical protein
MAKNWKSAGSIAILLIVLAGVGWIVNGGFSKGEREEANQKRALTFSDTALWGTFDSDTFKITFPVHPVHESGVSESGFSFDVYSSEMDSIGYVFTIASYPTDTDLPDSADMLEGYVGGLVSLDEDNHLASSTLSTFKGYPSVDFIIDLSHGAYMKGKAFIVDHTVYNLYVGYEGSSFYPKGYDTFIGSFAFIK